MNKSESKYFNAAARMDEAFLELLEVKDFEYITVKEICAKAGVNRSTFYLHYETIADLLEESVEYVNRQFESYFENEEKLDISNIGTVDINELYLITPTYLLPFLNYIRDHTRFVRAVIKRSNGLDPQSYFNKLFRSVFSPIMNRYHVAPEKQPFWLSYTVAGIMGIVKAWLEHDCRESVEFISEMIMECVSRPMK